MAVSVLEREMYSEAEAARLLRVPRSTLHYWLEGGTRRGREYRPVLRESAKGTPVVTWAEFIEAGLLRQYRRIHNVPMAELRDFIDALRDEFGIPYPLADRKPYIGQGRQLVVEAQEKAGLSTDFFLIAQARQQLVLTPASQSFVDRVTWEDEVATSWRPHDEPGSPVRVEPLSRFGRPNIAGISTEVLWEHDEAGESVAEISDAFEVSEKEVRWALSFENSLRAA